MRKKSPSLMTYVRKLDKAFSRYIRLRDAMPNGTFRCISCGQIKHISKADCGHYYSRRHMNTRYDEDNCHAECSYCNRMCGDHLLGYRDNLTKKIGENRVLYLKVKANETKKWSCFELEHLINYYKILADKLEKEKGIRL